MAQSQRKMFRIEANMTGGASARTIGRATPVRQTSSSAAPAAMMAADAQAILAAIAELKDIVEPPEAVSQEDVETFKHDMAEARRIEAEMKSIQHAIAQTKTEIATLHQSGFQGKELGKVTDELDAVVDGTEQATEAILSAAETIEDRVGNLAAKLDGDDQGMANDAAEAVTTIFEACNFQDITGQRITKVVRTMRFIEDRIDAMMDIWGGMESFADVDTLDVGPKGDAALLNGPAMENDVNVASQDDIDALFD